MFKKMSQVKWEEVRKKLVSLGMQVITDVNPETTVSGYLDGNRFTLCWLDGTSTCTLVIKELSNPNSPVGDPFVQAVAETMLKSNPFVIYENKKLQDWRFSKE
jgi:hypothetical protein